MKGEVLGRERGRGEGVVGRGGRGGGVRDGMDRGRGEEGARGVGGIRGGE